MEKSLSETFFINFVLFVNACRMCDSSDPAKAAELYILASEMNVVRILYSKVSPLKIDYLR